MYVSIGQAAMMLGVAIATLRNWEKSGKFLPSHRTLGGHRRYGVNEVRTLLDPHSQDELPDKKTFTYSRVSSSDQKQDLMRQKQRLSQYCKTHFGENPIELSDIGSGLNCKKPGLRKLVQAICLGQVSRLVLVNSDRLLRFGTQLVFQLCEFHAAEVVILDEEVEKPFEKELVEDVITLMSVFTARLYGKRSHKNRKAA